LPFDFYATGSFFQFFFFHFLIDFFLFFRCRLPFFSSENDILSFFDIISLFFIRVINKTHHRLSSYVE
jgi:hypothetical protein